MSDTTDQFVLTRYFDGSWSIETIYSEDLEKKEAFGYINIDELFKDQFRGGKN